MLSERFGGSLSPPRLLTWEEMEVGSGIRTWTEAAASKLNRRKDSLSHAHHAVGGTRGNNEAGRTASPGL